MFKISGLLVSVFFVGCVHTTENPKTVVKDYPKLKSEYNKNFMVGCASESGQVEFCQCCVDSLLNKYPVDELLAISVEDPEEAQRRVIVAAQENNCFTLFKHQKISGI